MAWFGPDEVLGRIEHAFKVERFLVNLGYFVAVMGVLGVVVQLGYAVFGALSWDKALLAAFGILAVTVLSGATAYASGTNVGLAAARLKRDVAKG